MKADTNTTIKKYILSHFSQSFFTLLIPLFSIASLIFVIKLSGYTSVIKITLFELLKLYIYGLPELLFYTLPVTFFITSALALHRLSMENEIIVLFALGVTPQLILKTLFKPACLLSLLLLFDFIVLLPLSKLMFRTFIDQKRVEGQFNISASEVGHSFGDWLVFVGQKNSDNSLEKVIIFKPDKDKETFIHSKQANVINTHGSVTLELENGKSYNYTKEGLKQMNFRIMHINNELSQDSRNYTSALSYWFNKNDREYKIRKFVRSLLLALFPLVSLFTVLSVGIIHARHSNGYVYLPLLIALVLFFTATFGLSAVVGFYTVPVVLFAWLSVSFFMYNTKILAHF